jgi:hypothetical protein
MHAESLTPSNMCRVMCSMVQFLSYLTVVLLRAKLGGSPCHHGMRMEGTASSWRLAANILNKQPGTNDKGWSSSLGVGGGANNPSP